MTNIRDMIHSALFTQADVMDGDITLPISGCVRDMIGEDERWVLTFRDSKKKLPLNTTMLRVLAQRGHDSENWIGHKIIIFHDPTVTYRGRVTGGVRIRWPDREPPRRQVAEATPPPADGDHFDDDVPF